MDSRNILLTLVIIASIVAFGYGAYWLYNVVVEDATNRIRIAVSQGVSEGISDGIINAVNPLTLPAKIFGGDKK
jgi:hypothetical protein